MSVSIADLLPIAQPPFGIPMAHVRAAGDNTRDASHYGGDHIVTTLQVAEGMKYACVHTLQGVDCRRRLQRVPRVEWRDENRNTSALEPALQRSAAVTPNRCFEAVPRQAHCNLVESTLATPNLESGCVQEDSD